MQSFPCDDWNQNKRAKLQKLLSCENLLILEKKGGGNSKVYRILADNKILAVKLYPPSKDGKQDRLAIELETYRFFYRNAIDAVPLLYSFCESERWLVIDWIEGVIPSDYSLNDIEQALQFLQVISTLSVLEDAQVLPKAAEACLSLKILNCQIQHRYQLLMSFAEENTELKAFLISAFMPKFKKYREFAAHGYALHDINPDSELAHHHASLIPADFGFHNSIRDKYGKLYFFDFDYFGWDDPVKLLADILWHPKMQLQTGQKLRFVQGISDIYHSDLLFTARFHYLYPLFGLRWVLILLNEFIPAYWTNRQHAGAHLNQDESKKIQLQRAQILLNNVQEMTT